MKHLKYKILLVLFVVSLISSLALSLAPKMDLGFCDVNEVGGCNTVASSPYNYTFGIHNSYYGILIFFGLSLMTFLQLKKPSEDRREIINYSVVAGSLIAFYFLYLQNFVIEAYCTYCIVVDISLIIALGVAVWKWKE
ncbi:MAG: vitamin K epoxide reductase family protein [Nanoarchaeota archaeon]|nr:vitamin K epoxide reductase family protein [Nanoarchaeota archaeon]